MNIQEQMLDAIMTGFKKAAYDMEAHAVRICPVDTGRLRASIRIEIKHNEVIISANTEYAGYVEFGTIHQRAQPYLRPAIHAMVKKYAPKRILEELRKLRQ